MHGVPGDYEYGWPILQDFAAESLSTTWRSDHVGRGLHRQPRQNAPDDRSECQEPERQYIASPWDRGPRDQEREGQAKRMAGEVGSHRPPAPLCWNLLSHEEDARRVCAAKGQREKSVEAQSAPVVACERGESDRSRG